MKVLTFFIVSIICLNSYSQHATINGRIVDQFNDYSYPYSILAISLSDTFVYTWNADSIGRFKASNIQYGRYALNIQHTLRDSYFSDTLIVDTVSVELNILSPDCDSVNIRGECRLCSSSEHVIGIDPCLIVDRWFKTKEDEERYYEELDIQGYSIENDVLIWVKDLIQMKKMYDPCFHWFCKKHQVIF